ncbi:hypothetical protein CAOG_07737 [Capsaspora owczarzaki ATCC 30864]|uniref:hypothetical protein n=1 Tax=Capsaspora owczarzaki (strain ATCC 30864) TaxID=595528 RepID=UPI0001FE4173|nr:hypothetical protein CAOG_07737 [Capsaspora owczarzaki ATCC 30864]|eukprot:XP_004343611.1 hypothetical protein CAOG_07737 [Capsaspora owczarzaki ATCC 30864]
MRPSSCCIIPLLLLLQLVCLTAFNLELNHPPLQCLASAASVSDDDSTQQLQLEQTIAEWQDKVTRLRVDLARAEIEQEHLRFKEAYLAMTNAQAPKPAASEQQFPPLVLLPPELPGAHPAPAVDLLVLIATGGGPEAAAVRAQVRRAAWYRAASTASSQLKVRFVVLPSELDSYLSVEPDVMVLSTDEHDRYGTKEQSLTQGEHELVEIDPGSQSSPQPRRILRHRASHLLLRAYKWATVRYHPAYILKVEDYAAARLVLDDLLVRIAGWTLPAQRVVMSTQFHQGATIVMDVDGLGRDRAVL